MCKMELSGKEKIFGKCNWGIRASVEDTLEEYISSVLESLISSEKKALELTEGLSQAILEDIEAERYAMDLWKKGIENSKLNSQHGSSEEDITKKFVESLSDNDYHGAESSIAKYTTRYGRTSFEKLRKKIQSSRMYVESHIGRGLYEKIYPVFWLEMLNCPHKKIDYGERFLMPISEGTEREQYLFALLLDSRVEDIASNTIFSGIQRLYSARLKRAKNEVKNFDMQDAEERHCFVRWMKNCLFREDKSGNRKKPALKNNMKTIREMLEIGGDNNLDVPAFIYFLDRLTGWIEFYNFVLSGDSRIEDTCDDNKDDSDTNDEIKEKILSKVEILEKKYDRLMDELTECTGLDEVRELVWESFDCIQEWEYWVGGKEEEDPEEDSEIDYTAFENLAEFNHIAFLYAWGKYIRNDKELEALSHSVLGRKFMEYMAAAYRIVTNKITYDEGNVNKDFLMESVWYNRLFEELFVNDISKVNQATRMDALNFYDIYMTFMRW